ncbi:hypothetical protein [Winogradskyella sp. 3972H.M.0a.05]|uniref:hypothetical protein n=1 Tax=Winogradskyella sp. 3972H.M.0a.05 TaxID=2950277 RepID=UPI00339527A8
MVGKTKNEMFYDKNNFKIEAMKPTPKLLSLIAFFALLVFTSCQDEATETTETQTQETIAPDSQIATVMAYASANYGGADNILDNSSCISVNLPVTIIANGITITIETLEDLALIEEIFEEFDNDEDILEFLFPITVILNDYTQVTIENLDDLEAFIDECTDEPDVIECIDFQYPISFSIFNTEFDIVDTVVIEDDEALYEFLESLDDEDNGVVLASLNYPVTLVYANGETIEVSNNTELVEAIEAAEEDCEDINECDITPEGLEEILLSCYFEADIYNANNEIEDVNHVNFTQSGEVIVNGDPAVTDVGEWDIIESDEGPVLVIAGLQTFTLLNATWQLLDCDDEELKFTNGENTLELECDDDNEVDCSAQEVAMYLQECHWYAGTNLFDNVIGDQFYFYPNGEVIVSNPETDYEIVGYWEVSLTDEGVFVTLEIQDPYDVISLTWEVYECDEDRIKLIDDDNYLVFERDCEETSDCEQGEVREQLVSCAQVPTLNEWTPSFTTFMFNDDNTFFTLYEGDLPYNGVWDIFSDGGNVYILITVEGLGDFNGTWLVIDCGEEGIVLKQGQDILVLECAEDNGNPLECFGNYGLSVCDEDDGTTDGFGVFDLELIFSNCPFDNVEYNFYLTIDDAENEMNPLTNPFVNTVNPQTIYSRVSLAGNPSVFEIFSHDLVVESCYEGCTEQQVDEYLLECWWQVANYNGSNNLLSFYLVFEPDQALLIEGEGMNIDASWSTSQISDGVVLILYNIAGPNIQAITGEWLVVECQEDRLELVSLANNEDFIVLERTCD